MYKVLSLISQQNIGFCIRAGCDYPTFYDSDNGQCVLTCPNGTYGVVNGNNSDVSLNHTRNCTTSENWSV